MAQAKNQEAVKEATEAFKSFGNQIKDRLVDLPDYGRDFYTAVDKSARANPWLHIGMAGVGALAIGYLIGRGMSTGTGETRMGIRPSGQVDIDE